MDIEIILIYLHKYNSYFNYKGRDWQLVHDIHIVNHSLLSDYFQP